MSRPRGHIHGTPIGVLTLFALVGFGCNAAGQSAEESPATSQATNASNASGTARKKMETATLGGGCFWCTEAVYQEIKGVESVVSGYSGGTVENPTYEQVCTGATGHAEVIQITYDPSIVSFEKLLEIHFKSHDPTTLNRQGADQGTQYRSVIFYNNDKQKELAEYYTKKLDESGIFSSPIVTEISPAAKFYPAERYHQDYYRLFPNKGYCAAVIRPKVEKIRKLFAKDLKP